MILLWIIIPLDGFKFKHIKKNVFFMFNALLLCYLFLIYPKVNNPILKILSVKVMIYAENNDLYA